MNSVSELSQIQQAIHRLNEHEKRLETLLSAMNASASSDNLRVDMIKAAEKILGRSKHRSSFKIKDYEQVSQLYVLVQRVLEQTNVTPLNEASLKELDASLKQLYQLLEELPNERSLKNKVIRFILTTIAALAVAALLTVPWFNAIFVVASVAVVLSSLKIGASLGMYGPLIIKILTSSLPGSDDVMTGPNLFDQADAFAKKGQTFFEEHKKKLQEEQDKNEDRSHPECHIKPGDS